MFVCVSIHMCTLACTQLSVLHDFRHGGSNPAFTSGPGRIELRAESVVSVVLSAHGELRFVPRASF